MSENVKTLPEVIAQKVGNNINIVIPGVGHFKRSGGIVEELYKACLAYDIEPSEIRFNDILSLINPIQKHLQKEENISIKNDNIYLGNINIPIPNILSTVIEDYLNEGLPIMPLQRFWENCNINPNKRARDDFFKYCRDFGVVITNMGYVVLYKLVRVKKSVERNKDLSRFIGEEIVRVKSMSKSTSKYDVWKSTSKGGFKRFGINRKTEPKGYEFVANLGDLENNILDIKTDKNTTTYTDLHTGKFNIHLGEKVSMDRDKCDPNINVDCSYGLHVGSYKYVRTFGNNYKENTVVLVTLVNPKDVVALPIYDHSKIRVCEYFPVGIIKPVDEDNWKEISNNNIWEQDYMNIEKQELEELLETLSKNSVEKEIVKNRLLLLESAK